MRLLLTILNTLSVVSTYAAQLPADSIKAYIGRIADLERQNELLQVRSNINFLSSIIILGIIMIFFMWGIRERNRKHVMLLERKNRALMRANKVAEEARNFAEKESHLKTIFLENLSHEIRTPLNQIYGFAQVMADEGMPLTEEEMKEMSKLICDGSAHLTRVIDNIGEVTEKLSKLTKLEDVESVLKSGNEQY